MGLGLVGSCGGADWLEIAGTGGRGSLRLRMDLGDNVMSDLKIAHLLKLEVIILRT